MQMRVCLGDTAHDLLGIARLAQVSELMALKPCSFRWSRAKNSLGRCP
jgi:hypothetical protein